MDLWAYHRHVQIDFSGLRDMTPAAFAYQKWGFGDIRRSTARRKLTLKIAREIQAVQQM